VGGYKGVSGGAEDCPTGTTGSGTKTAIDSTACDNLATGYYYTGKPGVAPAQVNAANVLVCTKGYFCDGDVKIDGASLATPKGRTACPPGTTTAAEADTNIASSFCKILLPTWHHNGFSTEVTTDTIVQCPSNAYCPGSCRTGTCNPENYLDLAPVGIFACPGYSCSAATEGTNPAACTKVAGGAGTSADKQSTQNSCNNLDAGFYYKDDDSHLVSTSTIRTCPINQWCDGTATITSFAVNDFGISGSCPAGSTSLAGSDAPGDCKLSAGYYYTGIGGVLSASTVQPCKPGNYCLGGGFITVDTNEQGLSACGEGKTCTAGASCTLNTHCV
jgi:hypothetical protein